MSEEVKLKECPFCGSSNVSPSKNSAGSINWITCNDCECDGPMIGDPIEKWNERVNEHRKAND